MASPCAPPSRPEAAAAADAGAATAAAGSPAARRRLPRAPPGSGRHEMYSAVAAGRQPPRRAAGSPSHTSSSAEDQVLWADPAADDVAGPPRSRLGRRRREGMRAVAPMPLGAAEPRAGATEGDLQLCGGNRGRQLESGDPGPHIAHFDDRMRHLRRALRQAVRGRLKVHLALGGPRHVVLQHLRGGDEGKLALAEPGDPGGQPAPHCAVSGLSGSEWRRPSRAHTASAPHLVTAADLSRGSGRACWRTAWCPQYSCIRLVRAPLRAVYRVGPPQIKTVGGKRLGSVEAACPMSPPLEVHAASGRLYMMRLRLACDRTSGPRQCRDRGLSREFAQGRAACAAPPVCILALSPSRPRWALPRFRT
eukprot:CAMPEP_0176078562 /NCGR_PEP_ID=MMETSP0120_2-20121206/39287_1 /TAXON_ID=160619 /ORGANISM="Kryptoperidinium foliaceum, Strain CCMP 1326" /LENGTH=363 /DNA_ID=CAMNT_0017412307 /DNA_START=15 /DNA_END=1104 /DNA_ORIENTATION=+